VAEALFGGLNVDGFFLEYDDTRSGGFEPLRFVPKSKMVVLGLVTTKRGASNQRTSSNDASRKPASTSISINFAFPPNAVFHRRSKATVSLSVMRSPSFASS